MTWWSRKRSDRDFREEIEAHLELDAERHARERGVGADHAHFEARRTFGNVLHAQERFYESQRWAWAERLRQHLRYTARSLRQHRGFSVAAVGTLTVGIGFCTAIFTIFNAVAIRGLPVRDAGRLVNVYQTLHGEVQRGVSGMASMVSYLEFLNYAAGIDSLRSHGGALSLAAVYAPIDVAFDRSPKGSARGEYVSCSYFATVGARLALGRGFTPDECSPRGANAVTVLSYSAWMHALGGDSTAIGRIVRINQVPVTVIGVAEPGFGGLTVLASDVWLPVTLEPTLDHGRDSIAVRDWSWMFMAARLVPGASIEAARSQLTVAARRRDAVEHGGKRQTTVVVAPGALLNFPEAKEQGALALTAVGVLAALVIAMVCANLMNLLLARGIARRREIGIRLAIGASRSRLVEQLLTESVVLALLGGALGLALSYALPALARRVIPIAGLQLDLTPDRNVLFFVILLSVITSIIFGLVPALQATGLDLVAAFKGGATVGKRLVRPSRIRSLVVGVQVAGSALLLVVAALFIRAATRAASADPGFTTESTVAFGLNVEQLGYTPMRTRAVYESLRERLASAPGVQSVALVSPLPLLGRRSSTVAVDSGTAARDRMDDVNMASVSGSFFGTMRIAIVSGRTFTDAEARASGGGSEPVVVSRSFANAFWPASSPIGKRLRVADPNGPASHVVVGVAMDTRYTTLAGESPFIYLPALPERDGRLSLMARVSNPTLLPQVERAVPLWARELDGSLVVTAERMSDRVALELRPPRLASAVAGTMGALALLLAIVGIYGVVSYAVSQRTRDIAVRLALGASRGGVVRLMMREGSRPVVFGLAVGLAMAFSISRVIRGLLFGMSGLDPVVYAGMAVLLMAASLTAMYAPARRAARVDPALTLREE